MSPDISIDQSSLTNSFLKTLFKRISNFEKIWNTPGTAGGPGGRDRTLAVAKIRAKMTFFSGGKKIT